ncbi:hypothetical protein M885DRAFT_531299 [Pelagophyceae sp. CCMP2097]|nr:hypothetical protein M885DRAFT_531299 [Pelagophyceae sp. CCMP2097]|mmetsp:Transcript_7948/g.25999  ORF Transcript_7948/g.25999 Transcript_7948/m.25999 type:complete len:286 (+) Transcript_7948:91-948(+)
MGNNWGKEDGQQHDGALDVQTREGRTRSIGEAEARGSPKRFAAPGVVPEYGAHHAVYTRPNDGMESPDASPTSKHRVMQMDVDEDVPSMTEPATPATPDEVVPTVFRWEHGGRQVYVTGTFNNWEKQIAMHRSGNDFTYIHNLQKGKHAYRFVVDDEWRFAPDQQTVADIEGRINNFIDVSTFDAYTGDENFLLRRSRSVDADAYARAIPDLDEYTKDPPPLPPHLRHIILNKPPPCHDADALPVPQHVALNHLYCTAIKDGMMVLGVTLRYRQHACTTVYYSCS